MITRAAACLGAASQSARGPLLGAHDVVIAPQAKGLQCVTNKYMLMKAYESNLIIVLLLNGSSAIVVVKLIVHRRIYQTLVRVSNMYYFAYSIAKPANKLARTIASPYERLTSRAAPAAFLLERSPEVSVLPGAPVKMALGSSVASGLLADSVFVALCREGFWAPQGWSSRHLEEHSLS